MSEITREGRAHPLRVEWLGSRPELRIDEAMAGAVLQAWRDEQGDILAFLPGVREIERTRERLAERLPGVPILPLHGQVEPTAQHFQEDGLEEELGRQLVVVAEPPILFQRRVPRRRRARLGERDHAVDVEHEDRIVGHARMVAQAMRR